MKNFYKYTAILLFLSFINLAFMIPGGPIETRQFAQYPSFILAGFNTFLTLLGLSSILGIYFIIKQKQWTIWCGFFCGIGYEAVYLLDLLKIFPVSPAAMPTTLFVMELIGAVLAFPLMIFSYLSAANNKKTPHSNETVKITSKTIITIITIIIVGIAIIIFATLNAKNS